MLFFDNSNVKLHYETYGKKGPWVVFVSGHSRPCSDFRQLAKFLEKKNFRILLFDNRGAGQTISGPSFSLEDIASDLNLLTSFLEISVFHLVGFSMGGIISRVFAHQYPLKVESLCLVSTPSTNSFLGEAKKSSWGKGLEDIQTKMASYVSEDFMKKNILLMNGMAKDIFKQIKTGFLEKSEQQKKAVEKIDKIFYSLSSLKQKVLIIHGSADKIIPASSAYELKREASSSELVVFDGAGHLLLIERTEQLYKKILNFLLALS